MSKDFSSVFIWAGNFDSEDEYNSFIEMDYSEENEDYPVSVFCGSIGLHYYDEDFQEFEYNRNGFKTESALAGFSWSQSFNSDFIKSINEKNLTKFNAMFLLYMHDELEDYDGFLKSGSLVTYIGNFNVDKNADSIQQ